MRFITTSEILLLPDEEEEEVEGSLEVLETEEPSFSELFGAEGVGGNRGIGHG